MRNLSIQLCLLSAFSLIIQSCGTENSHQLSDSSAKEPPLLVAMGGNQSCDKDDRNRENSPYGSNLYSKFKKLLSYLKNKAGVKPHYIVSCYQKSATVYFATSAEPNKIQKASRVDFGKTIQKLRKKKSKVFLMGHSYGGWLAMKLAVSRAENNQQLSGLFTLDPISRIDCSFSRPFGCQSSPKDIKKDKRQKIAAGSDIWVNYYQTKTFYLHASKINEADRNWKLKVSHIALGTNTALWNDITKTIEKYN